MESHRTEVGAYAPTGQLACREAGMLVRQLGSGIAISPLLIFREEEIAAIVAGIAAGLRQFDDVEVALDAS